MKVFELVEFLQQQDPNLDVAYRIYSEAAILQPEEIKVEVHGDPRPDGWVHTYVREDRQRTHPYLMFPGN